MTTSGIHNLVAWFEDRVGPELATAMVAAAVVVFGYLVAIAVRFVALRVFRRVSSQLLSMTRQVSDRAGPEASPESTARAEASALRVAGTIVFWLVFTLFLGAATTLLGFPILSEWLASLAGYLPRALAAAAIVLLGILSGLLLRVTITTAATSAGLQFARALGRSTQVAVIVLAAIVAVEELGIHITFLVVVAATVLGATLGGAALAFGLGARRSVSNLLASHYLSKWYREGQVVRIGEHQGRITEILPSAVVLDTDGGKVYVPAGEFARAASLLVADQGSE